LWNKLRLNRLQSLLIRSWRTKTLRYKRVKAWSQRLWDKLRLNRLQSLLFRSWNRLQPNRAKAWLVLGGIFSSVMLLSLGQSLASSGRVSSVFSGQELVQVLVAIIMFGYYLATAFVERPNYSYFLSGFLGISLVFGLWLVFLQGLGGVEIIALVSTGVTGLFFGSTKKLLGVRTRDLVKWLVHVGGWSFQGTSILASISPGPGFPIEVFTLLILIIAVVWGLILFRRS